MKFCRISALVLINIWLAFPVTAQLKDIRFTSVRSEDGLSSNTVNAIIKDRYGMLWFGTSDGLNRFDGTNFTVYRYKPDDPRSISANEILSLCEDKSGNLWVGTSGGSLNLYDRKTDSFIHFPCSKETNGIHNNVILSICEDFTGNIWIAHFNGINIIDPITKKTIALSIKVNNLDSAFNVLSNCLFEDSQNLMWIGTNQGLYQYNPITKSIVTFKHADNNLTSLINDHVNTITEDQLGNIWIGTDRGISKYNKDNKVFLNYQLHRGNNITLRNNIIFSISVDGENAWIGTADGLDILNTRTNEHSTYAPDNRNSHSLSSKLVRSIFIDKQGIFWLGTIRGGVNKFDRNLNLFNSVRSNVFDTQGLNARVATAFAETKDGKVFVGTDSKGVSLFNPTNRLFEHINIKSARNGNELYVIALEMSRQNKLLIGTLEDGLFALNIATGKCKQLLKGSTTDSLNSNEIHVVTTLRNGDIAVGTNGDGINILDSNYKVKLRYTRQPRMSNDKTLPLNAYIRDIKEDKDGNIWIGTHGGGMAELNLLSGKFTIYNSTNSPMPNDKVQSICIDSQGKVWAGTFGGGLVSFSPDSKQFESYSEKNGLQNNTVYTVIEDQAGLIWVSTNNGISSINPRTKKVNNYNYHNGIQHNNFVRGAGTLLTNGTLLFGGLDGFNYFNPSEIIVNSNIPPVQLTGLRIANQLVIASKDGPISEHISIAKEMSVDYQQSFSLEFVGLSYTSPEQNRYAYQMEGYDKDWIDAGNATSATYMNLAPGHYTFTVKSSNNDGVWNTKGAAIKVYVRPPLWRTTFAYTFYILALAGIGFYIRHKSIQNLRRKLVLQQEKIMAEQERREVARVHELDQQKIKFLTNLSHEFRTPISLILGPVDNLLAKEHSLQSYRQLDMIKRNGRRLLNLVNQLLDFRKMEEHELQLNKTHGELITFIKDVADSFKDLAERKEMNFYFHSEVNKFYTTFDHDKIERVLFNVLSNAFKFTRPGGTIELAIQKIDNIADDINTWMAITIRDTGIGMTDEVKEKIFSLFFQQATDASILNQGTGIGLTITKEFVKMHGGKIEVDSETEKGTNFSIHIPFENIPIPKEQVQEETLSRNLKAEAVIPDQKPAKCNTQMLPPDAPTILLVEDNEDFRCYLKEKLQQHHKVIEAENGREGWQKALALHPQLIISDISMPEMDGIDLCKKIKADKRTDHIPIILLTARIGEGDQLKGLETGANDYITKPFNIELLTAKINNLLLLSTTLKNTYTKHIKVVAPEIVIASADEELLQKIQRYLEENLSHSQLSVEELSKYVGMSRSSLYNKLLDLTGETPVEYIRSVKLEKAAILLEKSDLNVAQIAYTVGFSTPNYFAKSFKVKFNMLPSEYISKIRSEKKKA